MSIKKASLFMFDVDGLVASYICFRLETFIADEDDWYLYALGNIHLYLLVICLSVHLFCVFGCGSLFLSLSLSCLHVGLHLHTYAHTHTCTHTHMYACMHAHTHACTHTCVHTHTHTHTHGMHAHVCKHICTHMLAYMHLHIYANMDACTQLHT